MPVNWDHAVVLAVIVFGNTLAIWLAAWALVKNNQLGKALRATWYQLLLWIPFVVIILVLIMPVAAEVAMPESRDELLQRYGILGAVMLGSGVFAAKWAYELNLRAGTMIYGVAVVIQAVGYGVLLRTKPELWQWIPYSELLQN